MLSKAARPRSPGAVARSPGPGAKSALRRMKRGIAELYDCGEFSKPGPSSTNELFMWGPEAYGSLVQEFPDARANSESMLWRGLNLTSHFSGKGTAESILVQVHDVIRERVMMDGSVLGKDVSLLPDSLFSCDKSATAQKALLAMPCQHVFGSIAERVQPSLEKQLGLMEPAPSMNQADKLSQYEDIKKALFTASPPPFNKSHEAFCFKHGGRCPIWGHDAENDESSNGLLINMTGFSCTDWSKRRTSSLPGLSGKTAGAFWRWKREIKEMQPALAVWENSPFFPEDILLEDMDEYAAVVVMISPSLCGWPTNRLRKFGCLLHREKIAWLGNSEEFYRCFQRDLQLTGDVFFDLAPAEDIIEHMLFRSRNRGNHPSVTSISKPEDIKLESMITPAMNDRIKE